MVRRQITDFGTLDDLVIEGRNPKAALRIPILDKFIDRGTVGVTGALWFSGFSCSYHAFCVRALQIGMGKVESGTVRVGMNVCVMPLNVHGKVERIRSGCALSS